MVEIKLLSRRRISFFQKLYPLRRQLKIIKRRIRKIKRRKLKVNFLQLDRSSKIKDNFDRRLKLKRLRRRRNRFKSIKFRFLIYRFSKFNFVSKHVQILPVFKKRRRNQLVKLKIRPLLVQPKKFELNSTKVYQNLFNRLSRPFRRRFHFQRLIEFMFKKTTQLEIIYNFLCLLSDFKLKKKRQFLTSNQTNSLIKRWLFTSINKKQGHLFDRIVQELNCPNSSFQLKKKHFRRTLPGAIS